MTQSEPGTQSLPRIMMVDDELSNLQIVKIILTRENYECELLLYDNGREALDYLRGHPVDLILLDLAMPGMDGFELMTRLKENPATAEVPVIFLSAYQETDYILRAFELGARDFIGKPIFSPILTARIRQTIEAQRLQTELQRSNDELLNTNRLKDELLSICSHDLRAPLNSIELICQFLSDGASGPAEQSPGELINRIVSQTRLARRLVENLLDLNRIEEGRLVPSPSFFSVEELVRSCLDDELPTFQARKLEHALDLPAQELLCFADREMISQVVHNILNNAAKYAQSRVKLECALEDFSDGQGGRLALAIADDGRGIPPAQQQSVFDKYAKLELHGSGSGLGLYISRQMMELHEGSITVESKAGQGTRFVVRLPNVFVAEQLPDLAPCQQQRVAVVSASKPTAQLLEGVLVEAGMIEVASATTPSQLERLLDDHPPALVVVDVASELLAGLLVERLGAANPGCAWILYGEAGDAARLAARLRTATGTVPPPLNPLMYLREVNRLLQPEGNAGAAATV
ncbi:MAG TPA: hybrid sensor histidine kinase/response regulator [bacterium]|nr:hybrid sensor histidine kinase/response regulator [bacterium]